MHRRQMSRRPTSWKLPPGAPETTLEVPSPLRPSAINQNRSGSCRRAKKLLLRLLLLVLLVAAANFAGYAYALIASADGPAGAKGKYTARMNHCGDQPQRDKRGAQRARLNTARQSPAEDAADNGPTAMTAAAVHTTCPEKTKKSAAATLTQKAIACLTR